MLTSFHLHKKSSEVSIKARSTPASLSIQAKDTKHTTVKWPIGQHHQGTHHGRLRFQQNSHLFLEYLFATNNNRQ